MYEPLYNFINNSKIKKSNYKIKKFFYIVALGTNDAIYRNPSICAMTKEDYIKNIEIIVNFAKKNNIYSKFFFIAPWLSNPNDKYSILKESEKNKLLDEYREGLKNYCHKNNFLFINPNKYINEKLKIIENNISYIKFIQMKMKELNYLSKLY